MMRDGPGQASVVEVMEIPTSDEWQSKGTLYMYHVLHRKRPTKSMAGRGARSHIQAGSIYTGT